MFGRLKAMFGYSRALERPNPDPIRAQIVVATQRNERAGENARNALAELLDRNDGIRGTAK